MGVKMDPTDKFSAPLLHPAIPDGFVPGRVEKKRWYILLVYSLVATLQSLVWGTFSVSPKQMKAHYPGLTEAGIDLLLNWGSIVFVPTIFPASMILSRGAGGFKHGIRLAALLVFAGAACRTIPDFVPALHGSEHAVYMLHLGQFLNALAGPLVMAAPSKLSSIWFKPEERAFATSVGALANNFGATLGFLIGFAVRTSADVPWLMRGEALACAVLLAVIMAYFPSRPKMPPSATAAISTRQKTPIREFARGLLRAVTNLNYALVAVAGGLMSGTFNAWSASLPVILLHIDALSDDDRVWLGFASMVSMCLGSVGIGAITEKFFHRRLKRLSLILFSLGLASFSLFCVTLPIEWAPKMLLRTRMGLFPMLMMATCLGSFFAGGDVPVSYEWGVEATYPEPEALALAFNVLFNNLVGIVFLFTLSRMSVSTANLSMVGTCVICILMTALVKERYPRLDREIPEPKAGEGGVEEISAWLLHPATARGSSLQAIEEGVDFFGTSTSVN